MKDLKLEDRGDAVKIVQREGNARLAARGQSDYFMSVDGEVGPLTIKGVARAAYLLGAAQSSVDHVKAGTISVGVQRLVRQLVKRTPAQLARAAKRHEAKPPLRERAYQVAVTQVGVMETGGNNQGVPFTRYEKANGAVGPEPWCGDFVAWCYRQAGSKRVSRAWAAVRLIGTAFGNVATSTPHRGDLVRYDFSGPGSLSHVGIFVSNVASGEIETIEGNTGSVGAVSDSSTGGDGVYRKHRPTSLVHDYRHILG